MPTRKQEIYCQLLRNGILNLRMLCSWGHCKAAERNPYLSSALDIGWEEANFLHKVPNSILEPEYADNDLSFINWAFPKHIERLGNQLGTETAALMLEFYEGVPIELRSHLIWRPNAEFRALACQKPDSST